MTILTLETFQRILFLSIVIIASLTGGYFLANPQTLISVGIILFFFFGIPHGSLDVAIGKNLFTPQFNGLWWVIFSLFYFTCIALILTAWYFFPYLSFIFFLGISVFHFGYSDITSKGKFIMAESISRGLIPLCFPAFFYPEIFQGLMTSVITYPEAQAVTVTLQNVFTFNVVLLVFSLLYAAYEADYKNILELLGLVWLFIFFPPLYAFMIYFCFLHSFRHILEVIKENHLHINRGTFFWLIKESLPATLVTLLALLGIYTLFSKQLVDTPLMMQCFFISLAALTFPHMILTMWTKNKGKKYEPIG